MQKFGLEEKVINDIVNSTEKDRSAIINTYQYTFELFWKTLQKYMQQQEMLDELGTGSVIRTAFQYQIIDNGPKCMEMLKDRNLIIHTYKEDIYLNIKNEYIEILEDFIENFNKRMKNKEEN